MVTSGSSLLMPLTIFCFCYKIRINDLETALRIEKNAKADYELKIETLTEQLGYAMLMLSLCISSTKVRTRIVMLNVEQCN